MPLSSDHIPNRPLTGDELRLYVLRLLDKRLSNDCRFSKNVTYRTVAFDVVLLFHFGLPLGEVKVSTFTKPDGAIAGAPPLQLAPEDPSAVLAASISETVESPNLARIEAGLPISVAERMPANPGDLFPKLEHHELVYDRGDYPPLPPPVEVDRSSEQAKEWGVTMRQEEVVPNAEAAADAPINRKRKSPKGQPRK